MGGQEGVGLRHALDLYPNPFSSQNTYTYSLLDS